MLKKAASAIIAAISIFSCMPHGAQADWVDFDAGSKADQALTHLGFDLNSVKYAASSFNSSQYKKQQPQVSLTFTPTDPIDGEKVNAIATPTYFLNDSNDLYYTWYLKSKDCPKGKATSSNKDKCDLNHDGRIDIDDYKIKAMRAFANGDFNYKDIDYDKDNDDDGYEAVHGGDDQSGKTNYCYLHDTKTGSEYKLSDYQCDHSHLFPNAPGSETGDGSFGLSEERFWHTNPDDSDTANTGGTDESNVAGLGAKSFTWTYSSGDEIGVVIEGVSSEPTQTYDASYKIMWAFLNNKCDIKKKNSDGTTGMTMDDVNDCLYDNLVTPSEGTGTASNLDISIAKTPETPINDESGNEQGDEADFSVSLNDNTDGSYIHYAWEVFQADDAGTDDWGDSLAKSDIPNASLMSGIGIKTFKFDMDFIHPKKFMKVSVTATETLSDGNTRQGHDFVVFPVNSTSDDVKAYSTEASSDGSTVSMDKSNRICLDQDGNPKKVCPIVKDEIIGLELDNSSDYDDFAWTINGDPVSYDECFFSGCKENGQLGKMYFPVLDEVGNRYDVKLVATKDSGEKISIDKLFEVTEPSVNIVSTDTSVCRGKYLGKFQDPDGTSTPVYSTTEFEAAAGYDIEFMPETVGIPALDGAFSWFVDGDEYSANDDGSISLAKGDSGNGYTVSVYAHYSPDQNIMKALNKYWDVSYNDISSVDASKTIYAKFVTGFPGRETVSEKPTAKRILATIASDTPGYFVFLLRIVLSVILIVFTMRFVFSFSARTND